MVRRILILMALMVSTWSHAAIKPARLFGTVQFNRSSVVQGQALVMTLSVYTNTWFNEAPNFGDFQIPGAIIVPIMNEVPNSQLDIGSTRFFGISKRYLVYPLLEGSTATPDLEIVVYTPDQGDYKAKKRVVKVKSKSVNVRAVPEEAQFTASSVRVRQKWSSSKDTLLQGDLLERKITITAQGTQAALISPSPAFENDKLSVYPGKPELQNKQRGTSNTAIRTEQFKYLISGEGEVVLPSIALIYYDFERGKLDTVKVEGRTITANKNDNLEFMLSMQDSLAQVSKAIEEAEVEREPWSFWGLNAWQWALIVLGLSVLIRALIPVVQKIKQREKAKAAEKRASEAFLFDELKTQCSNKDKVGMINAYYRWLLTYGKHYEVDRAKSDEISVLLEKVEIDAGKAQFKDILNRSEELRTTGMKVKAEVSDPYAINP